MNLVRHAVGVEYRISVGLRDLIASVIIQDVCIIKYIIYKYIIYTIYYKYIL
jgi:hypothetical protein